MFLSVWSLEEYFLLGNSNTYGFHAAFNGISLSLGERVAFLAMCGEYGGKVQKGSLSLPGRQALVARWNQGNSCGLAALQDSKAAKKRQDDLKIPATMSWLNTPLNCWNRCVPLYNNKLTSNHIIFFGSALELLISCAWQAQDWQHVDTRDGRRCGSTSSSSAN